MSNPFDNVWAEKWVKTVSDGGARMSQRKLTSIEQRGGGLPRVRRIAKKLGVHLLLIEDEHGEQVVAASTKPFKTIC